MDNVAFLFGLNICTILFFIILFGSVVFSFMATGDKFKREVFKIGKFTVKMNQIIITSAFVFFFLLSLIMHWAQAGWYFRFYTNTVKIYWYAICIVTGIVVAVYLAYILLKKKGYKKDYILDLALWTIPIAILGARIYYGLFDDAQWTFADFWNFRNGGIAIFGAILFGALGVTISAIVSKKPILKTLDIVAAVVLFGQMVGRWGNFFNQEAFGQYVGESSWFPYAVHIVGKNGFIDGWYQATFFYEFILNLAGFVLLYTYAYKYNKVDGNIVCGYCLWYGMTRVLVEGLRTDSLYIPGTMIRISQLVSLIMVVIGIVGLFLLNYYKKGKYYHHFVQLDEKGNKKVLNNEKK